MESTSSALGKGQVRFPQGGMCVGLRLAPAFGDASVHFVERPSAAPASTSVVVPPSATVPGMVGGPFAVPQPSALVSDPNFVALQNRVSQMAEALKTLVSRGAAPVTSAINVGEGAGSGEPTSMPQGSVHLDELEDLTKIYRRSSGDESDGGNVSHGSYTGVGGPNRWYFPKKT